MKGKILILPVQIRTNSPLESKSELETAGAQIELGVLYLESIFNLIGFAAREVESRDKEDCQEFCLDLANISQVGYAVADAIMNASQAFHSVIEAEKNNE